MISLLAVPTKVLIPNRLKASNRRQPVSETVAAAADPHLWGSCSGRLPIAAGLGGFSRGALAARSNP